MIKLNRGHDKNIVLSKEALKEIRGLSAYEIAKQEGFTGTVDEWLASLKGAKGDKGDTFKLSDLSPEELASNKGPRVRPVIPVLKVHKVILVQKVIEAMLALKVTSVHKVQRANKGLKVHKVFKGLKVLVVSRVKTVNLLR